MKNKKGYIKKDYYLESNEKKYQIVKEPVYGAALHFHDYLELELVLNGTGTQYINDYKVELSRGCFTLLRPNIDCHSIETDSFDVFKAYVKPFIVEPNLWKEISLLSDPTVIKLEGEVLDQVISMFEGAFYCQDKHGKFTEEIVKNTINSILYLFVQEKDYKENNVTKRKELINYLLEDDKFLTDVSLQDFADDFGYSLSHASKYFKENTGMTFSEAKLFYRIQNAKRLILSTDYSINEIATMCGFNYYHLFHNLFKKNTGMTPLEFKKKNK